MEVSSLIKLLIIPSNIIQYNAALAITEAIRRTSKEKLYQEPGLQFLQSRRWFRKLSLFHKIIKSKSPSYLYHLIPKQLTSYSTRNSQNLPPIKANHSFFKNTFFFHPPSSNGTNQIRIFAVFLLTNFSENES